MEGGHEGGEKTVEYNWSVRVHLTGEHRSVAYTGRNSFEVGKQASFSAGDARPSAVEYLLGALGGDLVEGFRSQAGRIGIPVEGAEAVVAGHLGNPLILLGVVGAEGSPGIASIRATLYVTSDAEDEKLQQAWRAVLATSPLVNTLNRAVELSLQMQLTP